MIPPFFLAVSMRLHTRLLFGDIIIFLFKSAALRAATLALGAVIAGGALPFLASAETALARCAALAEIPAFAGTAFTSAALAAHAAAALHAFGTASKAATLTTALAASLTAGAAITKTALIR